MKINAGRIRSTRLKYQKRLCKFRLLLDPRFYNGLAFAAFCIMKIFRQR